MDKITERFTPQLGHEKVFQVIRRLQYDKKSGGMREVDLKDPLKQKYRQPRIVRPAEIGNSWPKTNIQNGSRNAGADHQQGLWQLPRRAPFRR
jgi:hypothetical protein